MGSWDPGSQFFWHINSPATAPANTSYLQLQIQPTHLLYSCSLHLFGHCQRWSIFSHDVFPKLRLTLGFGNGFPTLCFQQWNTYLLSPWDFTCLVLMLPSNNIYDALQIRHWLGLLHIIYQNYSFSKAKKQANFTTKKGCLVFNLKFLLNLFSQHFLD